MIDGDSRNESKVALTTFTKYETIISHNSSADLAPVAADCPWRDDVKTKSSEQRKANKTHFNLVS